MPIVKCDCFFITELNMELNEISKKYIKVCEKHADIVLKNSEIRHEFKFNKKKKLYYNKNSTSDTSLSSKDLYVSGSNRSLNNSTSTNSIDSDNSDIIDFGKYRGLTFEEVCQKYRNYCVNILNIKSRKDIDNDEMDKFVDYLKAKFK
jgi:hypothetical protein